MADLWISELGTKSNDRGTIAQAPVNTRQTKTIGSEVKSNAFGSGTYSVRLKAVGAACIFKISAPDGSGTYESASTSSGEYLSDGETEVWGVSPGMKISVISTSGS